MIILGLLLVLLAVAAGILLFEGTSAITDGVDIDILNGTVSLPPLALLLTGAAVISVFWLGWALMRLMIEWAKADGIRSVEGQVLRENTTMLAMCRSLGFAIRADPDDPDLRLVTLPVATIDEATLP